MRRLRYVALLALALLLAGCGRNMYDQAKYEPLERSTLFEDGSAARPLIEGTVPRGRNYANPSYYTGLGSAGFVAELPMPLTEELLTRGQERYNIYCSPCHNYSGNGGGMIVQKGFVQPSSFHEQRLRDVPVGYFVNAMANGFGRMYSYASRIPPEDRWAIAAYVRALQLSQNATLDDMPANLRSSLNLPIPIQEANR